VYRVDASGRTFVLKVGDANASVARWRGALSILRAASSAGVAPPIVHVDENTSRDPE
jgi:hypothetical protein